MVAAYSLSYKLWFIYKVLCLSHNLKVTGHGPGITDSAADGKCYRHANAHSHSHRQTHPIVAPSLKGLSSLVVFYVPFSTNCELILNAFLKTECMSGSAFFEHRSFTTGKLTF